MALLDRILDLVFPPKCKFCGALVDRSSLDPCPKCPPGLWLEGPQAVVPGDHFARCVCAAWYTGALREEVKRFKFRNQPGHAKAYGPMLARTIRFYLPGAYDLITWVPVSPETLETRGYDQARLLAEETAKALGTEALPLLEKIKNNKPQSSLEGANQRWKNVKGVYAVPDPAALAGKRVLVIDDILTTGATLEEAARTLRQAGAAQVVAAAFCRTPKD